MTKYEILAYWHHIREIRVKSMAASTSSKKELFGVCPFVTSQKILQGKWAILVLHELSLGTRRFNELERELQITHATLSAQLKYLEREGIVLRTVYPEVPPRVEYSLTDIGKNLPPCSRASATGAMRILTICTPTGNKSLRQKNRNTKQIVKHQFSTQGSCYFFARNCCLFGVLHKKFVALYKSLLF